MTGREYVYGERTFVLQERKDGTPLVTMSQMGDRREEVVRCRDCERSFEERGDLWCRGIVGPPVEPDGFCAWGERR